MTHSNVWQHALHTSFNCHQINSTDSRRTRTVTQKAATLHIQVCDSTHYIPHSTVTKGNVPPLNVKRGSNISHSNVWEKPGSFECMPATYLIQMYNSNMPRSNVWQQHASFKCVQSHISIRHVAALCDSCRRHVYIWIWHVAASCDIVTTHAICPGMRVKLDTGAHLNHACCSLGWKLTEACLHLDTACCCLVWHCDNTC